MDNDARSDPQLPEIPGWAWVAILPVAILFFGVVSRGREVSPLTRPIVDTDGRWLMVAALTISIAIAAALIRSRSNFSLIRGTTGALSVLGGSWFVFTLSSWQSVLLIAALALFIGVGIEVLVSASHRDLRPAAVAWVTLGLTGSVSLLPFLAMARFRFSPFVLALGTLCVSFLAIAGAFRLFDWVGRDVVIATAAVGALLASQVAWIAAHIDLQYTQLGLSLALACGALAANLSGRTDPEPSVRIGLEPALVAASAALVLMIGPV